MQALFYKQKQRGKKMCMAHYQQSVRGANAAQITE